MNWSAGCIRACTAFLVLWLACVSVHAENGCATIVGLTQNADGSYDMTLDHDTGRTGTTHPSATYASRHKVGDRIQTNWRGDPFGDEPCATNWSAMDRNLGHVAASAAANDPAPPDSPFNGVWGGERKSMTTYSYSEFQFTVVGNALAGQWVSPTEAMPLTGTVSGNTVNGRVDIKGGASFTMEMVDPNTIRFRTKTFMGDKFTLTRLSKEMAEQHRGSTPTTLGVLLSGLAEAAPAAAPTYASPSPQPSAVDTTQVASGCDGYPLQSPGQEIPGFVCRCRYGPSGRLGWWAVQPGNPGSQPLRCGPPGQGEAVATVASPRTPAAPAIAPPPPPPPTQATAPRTQATSQPSGSRRPPSHSHELHADDVGIDGKFVTNWHNDQMFVVRVQNRAAFPIDCDVSLTASFWSDTLAGLNPISGPGLANIRTEHGKVLNLQPGNWGTAIERTHLVQNSRIDYTIERCSVSQMHLLSERQ